MSATYAAPWLPRGALVQLDSPHPARYLVRLNAHTLNHGMPARRRGGRAWAVLGRRGLPVEVGARALRLAPRRAGADLATLRTALEHAWPRLAVASDRLPRRAPRMTFLALRRSAGRFVFVFGDGPDPLLLLKPPSASTTAESTALAQVAGTGVAPRELPAVAGLLVQEGLPGMPLWVLAPGAPGWSAGYDRSFEGLGEALVEVAGHTAHRAGQPALAEQLVRATEAVSSPVARRVDAARRDLAGLDTAVLEHHDLSAQNWLVGADGRFAGLVDWEEARVAGLPGYDALHAAVALVEHGVALRAWSQQHVVETFTAAWHDEPFLEQARDWHRRCVVAATGSDRLAEPLVVAYFASRLARRLTGGGPRLLEPATASAMLEVVAR
ncbi:hypothetical protein I601_3749 [Nocardioides dokdonensis FR1436]|uniref:Aminoglycoside phosphotransferase domain-containing protein n=1 Tax=Nocardioides dokdonensis FR1436 TaxID=1300347 RepID=A0A1A9GPD1_9ACTN|nr:phosphotransferase [Nocardioides dokdonensis]ANH40148.1 hypothetical protein I601_3749 [Nocardioides dokdonensis FR1436]